MDRERSEHASLRLGSDSLLRLDRGLQAAAAYVTGTAALFVVVCWMLSNALRSTGRGEAAWLLVAAVTAGLSMILKVTGVFCFPVVGVVTLVIFRRGLGGSRWWVIVLSTLLMVLPFSLWALRNILLAGTIEAGKISHEPELLWGLLANLSRNAAGWFLPPQLAQSASANLHPLAIMLPVILLPISLTAHSAYRRCPEALLAGACASLAFVGLALMMVTKFTEEARYWSVMLPCIALAALALKPPGSKTAGAVFRVVVTLFVLFCCARFSVARQYLWYGTSLGFFVQQALLAISLVGGLLYLHRVVREFWPAQPRSAARRGDRGLRHCGRRALAFRPHAQTSACLRTTMPDGRSDLAAFGYRPPWRFVARCLVLSAAGGFVVAWRMDVDGAAQAAHHRA
ncbi:MAG: hypothetical protein IIA33_04255 [Planctomycetes bacterium]|nr:hypothetical protein [Planctomycetota bacterium]